MTVSVASQCASCDIGLPVVRPHFAEPRGMMHIDAAKGRGWLCGNYDSECRHIGEPLGWYTFAWRPKMCRNGLLRWLTWVERHDDGTYSLGNRAH